MLGALENCFGVKISHKVLMNYTLIKKKKKKKHRVPFLCKPQISLITGITMFHDKVCSTAES